MEYKSPYTAPEALVWAIVGDSVLFNMIGYEIR